MKKLIKSKIFWVVLGVVIVGGLVAASLNKSGQVEYTTEPAKIASIVQTVAATGQVKSASEIELNFKNAGKLQTVNVKKGDAVKTNQILAQLKATDLQISVGRAQADLLEARASLAKVVAGATPQEIAVAQASRDQAQINLISVKSDLTATEKTYLQVVINKQETALSEIEAALTQAKISLQVVDDAFNFEGDADNFATYNNALEVKTQDSYNLALKQVNEAETDSNRAQLEKNEINVDLAMNVTLSALSSVRTMVENLGSLLSYVTVTSVLTQTKLDTLKADVNSERNTTNSSIDSLQTAKQVLVNARLDYQTKVEEAQNAISAAEKSLAKAQADLDLKQAATRSEDIALYQARVQKALADLALAQDRYEETIIRAPIDGVITEINFEVGEQTTLSQPTIEMLAIGDKEIEVDIPESDISKMSVGNEVTITLDAFSDEEIFAGSVTHINPAQTEIQDVIYYKVTVGLSVEQPQNVSVLIDRIKPGMTANVEAMTAKKDNVLVIPSRAVREIDGTRLVRVLENGQIKEVSVVLGLRGDEGLVEVVSGLQTGQLVVTATKQN